LKKSPLTIKIQKSIQDSTKIVESLIDMIPDLENSISLISKCISQGGKIVLFGNGGSAADSQHIAAELIGRFKINRKSFPAIALTTDTSCITALSNDYSFDIIFSRQCESLVQKNDVVIGISTSGKSKNVLKGLQMAKKKGGITIGLLGSKKGPISKVVDIELRVNSSSTSKIQEAHRIIYHVICEHVENNLTKGKKYV
tara:strand:- start:8199 stop:8795 length:597 start_codon:yes stop_codon:yes gene_type:complete